MHRPARMLAAVLVSGLALTACSGSDAPTDPVVQPDPPGTVGATGGTVAATGGGATVNIPAGALTTKTQITIAPQASPPADPNLLGGTAWTFGPSGTQFSQPVAMTLQYDASRVPDGLPETSLYIAKDINGKWERIPGTFTIDQTTKRVTGQVSSFSSYSVLADPCTPRPLAVGTVSGELRDGDCVFGAASQTPQTEDVFEFTVAQTSAFHVTMTGTGFRPSMGIKEKAATIDDGVVYAFRSVPEGGTESKVEVILAPGTYHLWAGNRDGLGGGAYQLQFDQASGDNRLGCRAYFARPPIDMQQEINGSHDCNQTIEVSPDPAFIGQTIAEEYYYVKVMPGQTLQVTVSPVSGEEGFAPFPTIFLPSGGAIQDSGNGPTRSVQFNATAQGYMLVGVSSVFNKSPQQGGRYTQGTYRLQISLQ